MNNKRLYRSRDDKKLAGVCGGLGEYFKIDPVMARLGFVLFSLAGGSGLLVYLIMALVIPQEPEINSEDTF